jgi:hypothetical protein
MRPATSIVLLMVAAPAAACGIGSIAEPELDAFDVAEVNGQEWTLARDDASP